MSKNNNISTLNEALPMLRELENECGEDMPIYNVITELLPYLDKADLQSVIDEANILLKSQCLFYFPTGFSGLWGGKMIGDIK